MRAEASRGPRRSPWSKRSGAGWSASSAAILTEYRGLSVKDMAALRRTLRDAGADYKVYKNTLVRFAAVSLDLEGLVPFLEGPTAIAFTDGDAVPVAKALRDFARVNTKLVLKGGVLGHKVMSQQDTAALADLPPRDVVLARLAGAFAAPMQQFAGLLAALPRNFAYGLKALLEQGGAPGAPAAPVEAASVAEAPADAPPAAADVPVEAALLPRLPRRPEPSAGGRVPRRAADVPGEAALSSRPAAGPEADAVAGGCRMPPVPTPASSVCRGPCRPGCGRPAGGCH